ncbi:hypothetical protein [Rhizobium leguminosarum]|uniref:hypothetical protein n=1 Tax=Rhizobium leguminosarum TaxID=384 RepID=UPI003F97EAC9
MAASTPTWWTPLSASPGKAVGLAIYSALEFVSICTIRCSSSRQPLSNPRISFETGRRPVFFVAESAGKTIVNVPFGDQNSTNAKNGSPLTDAK